MNKGFTPHHFCKIILGGTLLMVGAIRPLCRESQNMFFYIINPFRKESGKSGGGFTLTETLVILAIFAIVIVGISSTLFLAQKWLAEGRDLRDINHEGRKILTRMSREIRQTKEIVTELPGVDSGKDNPSEIEFEDGHTPSPYEYLGSDFYYIRYLIYSSDGQSPYQLKRQYRVYCLDDCEVCEKYYSWTEEQVHPCNLEENIIGSHIADLEFWGAGLINVNVSLEKGNKKLNLKTKISGRGL